MMRMAVTIAAVGVLLLGGCRSKHENLPVDSPDSTAASHNGEGPAIAAPAAHKGPSWVEADGPGETAVEWRQALDQPGFMLSCEQDGPTFRISLPDPATPPTSNGSRATLYLDDDAFPLTVLAGEVIGPHLDGELPITPEFLEKLGHAKQVRLAVGAAVAETGPDVDGKLAAFAGHCAMMSGTEFSEP